MAKPSIIFNSFPECKLLENLIIEAEKGIQFINPSEEVIRKLLSFEDNSSMEQLGDLLKVLFHLNEHVERRILSNVSCKNQLSNTKNRFKIARTTRFILENLDQKLSVERMADFTHLVPQSFCRWFKNATGNTFVNYLNKARIEKACQLLMNTNQPVSDICFIVGFESISHFNRTFLKIKEMSPREFRKSM